MGSLGSQKSFVPQSTMEISRPKNETTLFRGPISSGAGDEYGIKYNEKGVIVYLQAIVSLVVALRVLYFFRGSLVLGTLVASFVTIVRDSLPLLLLVTVFLLSFSFSITVLMQAACDFKRQIFLRG